jgi:predicted P-loop ATPase
MENPPKNQTETTKRKGKVVSIASDNTKGDHFETVFHQVEKYLRDNYKLRYNQIKCEIECSAIDQSNFQPVNENSLYIELRKKKVKISKDDVKSILKSDFTSRFNPIAEYFNNLPIYDPTKEPDHIANFASFVKAEEQDEFNKHYKKWLVRAVRCALDDGYYNKQAFILVHEAQNSGKTTWCRFHCPAYLKDYFAEEISTDKDGLILLAKNFLINLDELSTLQRAEINSLKSYFSKDRINIRLPYDSKNSNIPRKCSFIGSTNLGQFLQDETGSVRWLCFQITSIDWDYAKEVNIDNVWRQALYLWRSGTFRYDLAPDEILENENRNMKFQQLTIEADLIAKYFEKPTDEAVFVRFMQAHEIVTYLIQKTGIRANNVMIGKAMTRYGFERVKKYKNGIQVYGYNLVETENS